MLICSMLVKINKKSGSMPPVKKKNLATGHVGILMMLKIRKKFYNLTMRSIVSYFLYIIVERKIE
jgi:hypothetical protein